MTPKAKSQKKTHSKTIFTRREFCVTGASALTIALAPAKALASFAESKSTAVPSLPTLDELGTGWLDCGLLAQMPSLHNFHEMAACAPDLVGVNFLPGGQLYGDESGPRWPIYHSLPLCGMTIDGRSYDAASCRWFAYQV